MVNIITQLNTLISTSNPSDISFIFASYVRGNLNSIENMSIDEIAQVCNTSSSSISRLVSKMGYKSYKEFRKECIQTLELLRKSRTFNQETVKKYGLTTKTVHSFFDEHLVPLIEQIKQSDVDKMLSWMTQTHLYFYGSMDIHYILEELQAQLSGGPFGSPILFTDLSKIQNLKQTDNLIIVSVMGNSFNNKQALNYLNKCKAKKLLIKTTLNQMDTTVFDDTIELYSNINNGIINNYLIRFFIDMSFNQLMINEK